MFQQLYDLLESYSLVPSKEDSVISEEQMEEYRMITFFDPQHIRKYHKMFFQTTEGSERMDQETFYQIPCISINPFKEKIAMIFGFDQKPLLEFIDFLTGASLFNCHGRKDLKIRTAYRLQDIDNDGVISKQDLMNYLKIITNETLLDFEITEMVNRVMNECSSDVNQESLTLQDFQRVITKSDFETKLKLNFF
jgi:Ca2+-binding EF-hand superfamily protein